MLPKLSIVVATAVNQTGTVGPDRAGAPPLPMGRRAFDVRGGLEKALSRPLAYPRGSGSAMLVR